MSNSFYGTNTRGNLFYEFLDMATPIESIINTPLIVSVGESVRLLCLCLDPMSISSVLVIFRVNLFALNQL